MYFDFFWFVNCLNWILESATEGFFFKVGLGILQITSGKQCPQVWPCFGRSLFSTDFVECDQAV